MTSRNNKLFSYSCLILLCVGFVYGLVLPFCWGNNPMEPTGTLSLLCEHRNIYFWLWTIVDGGAIFLNMSYLFVKYGNSTKLVKAFQYISYLAAIGIAATLDHSIADWNPKRVIHWIATGAYVVFLFATIALYALKNIRRSSVFKYMLIAVTCIILVFILMFAIIGKSGIMEIIPHAMLEVLLFVLNFIVKAPAGGPGKTN